MKTITKYPLYGSEMTRRYYGVSCNECEFKCSEQDTAVVAAGVQARADIAKLKDSLLTIANGYEQRNIAPFMNGTNQSGPHLIDRKRMMEIAKEALGVVNA